MIFAFSLVILFGTDAVLHGQNYSDGGDGGSQGADASSASRKRTGTLRGSVIDAGNGEILPGTQIVVPDAQKGAIADLDGQFRINGLSAGSYEVIASYATHQPDTLQAEVSAGEVTVLDFRMRSQDFETETIEVTGRQVTNNELAMLSMRKNSAVVQNGISMEQIRRNGDLDAGAATRRIPGISMEDGRYIYVRGLGDRYSKTTLNRAEIPSLDPERNAVQMDLFPSQLLDNLVIYKTFSPDMPGDFAGGLVNITTRSFPEKEVFNVSAMSGFNTQASLEEDFLTYKGGDLDWLGLDDGTRDIPDAIPDDQSAIPGRGQASTDPEAFARLEEMTKSFSGVMAPIRNKSGLNQIYQLSYGNQYEVGGRPLGLVTSLSYQSRYKFYDDGVQQRWKLVSQDADALNNQFSFRETRGQRDVLWGGLASLSYKPWTNHRISLTFMENHSGRDEAITQEGPIPMDDGDIRQNRALSFKERSIRTLQLNGESQFGSAWRLQWVAAWTRSTQDEPDLRFFTNEIKTSPDGTRDSTLIDSPSEFDAPTRFFRDMDEDNFDLKVDLTREFKLWGREMSIKTGGAMAVKDRSFRQRRFNYEIFTEFQSFNGDAQSFFRPENITVPEEATGNRLTMNIIEQTNRNPGYNGNQVIGSGYLMGDIKLTRRLRAIGGVRVEMTDISVESLSKSNDKDGQLDASNILPSLNLVYELNTKMNLRAAYGRTIGRPTFREFAPFASFNFIGDFILNGEPDLEITTINNFDLRWEWFPDFGELVSASLFFKEFNDPIERIFTSPQGQGQLSFRNVDNATNLGAEVEFKKNLGFLAPALENFSLGANGAYIYSRVQISESELQAIRALRPGADDERKMFNQSPFIVNANMRYSSEKTGWNAQATFNIFGERIAEVGVAGTPNIVEKPRPRLDATLSKEIGKHWRAGLQGRNLLNPETRLTHEFKGQEFDVVRFTRGRTIRLQLTYQL